MFITLVLLASNYFGIIKAPQIKHSLYFVWFRITDEGSIPEMRIWLILLIQNIATNVA